MTKFYSSDEAEYKIDKTEFEFVQLKEDIADETFQDKAIGFFKDAMMRFCRSKVSIIAFIGIIVILLILILAIMEVKTLPKATVLVFSLLFLLHGILRKNRLSKNI